MVEIYLLLDLTSGLVRYVGQSVNARKRLWAHLWAARHGRPGRVYNWLRKLLEAGHTPCLAVVDRCDPADADACECYWIAELRSQGFPLANLTDGGGGIRGHKHTVETKARIGRAHAGKVISEDTRSKLSALRKGRKLSAEHRANIGKASTGRLATEQTKKKLSELRLGNKHPLGCVRSPETRAKMRASARRGDKNPKAKVSDARAAEIRRLFESGVRQCVLARMFDVDTVCVHRIVRAKTYKTPEP